GALRWGGDGAGWGVARLWGEEDPRVVRTVALVVQAAARHGKDFAGLESLGLAIARQPEVALQHHGAHVEGMAVLGVHLGTGSGVGDDVIAVSLELGFEGLLVHLRLLQRAARRACAPPPHIARPAAATPLPDRQNAGIS